MPVKDDSQNLYQKAPIQGGGGVALAREPSQGLPIQNVLSRLSASAESRAAQHWQKASAIFSGESAQFTRLSSQCHTHPRPPEVEMGNGRQAGKTLDRVLGDRYRSRARRQEDGSLWRRWLHVWNVRDAKDSRPRLLRFGLTEKMAARTMRTGFG